MDNSELKKLYNSLRKNNYDVPDNYDDFEYTLTEPTGGAAASQALYNSLVRAHV